MAQTDKNLQKRPNSKHECKFQELSAEAVTRHETSVMRQIADFALIPPEVNTSPLPEYGYDTQDYVMALTIKRTAKGQIWSAWIGECDCPNSFLMAATSDDNGESWSNPCLVIFRDC